MRPSFGVPIAMILVAILLWTILFAPMTAFIAGQRGYPVMTWYVLGLLLGPLGCLARLLPKRRHEPDALMGFEQYA